MDHKYRARHKDNQCLIGRSTIKIDGVDDSLHIDGVHCKGTPNLYKFLFMKHPQKTLTMKTIRAYKNILIALLAHKLYHAANATLKANKSEKWTNIISPMYLTPRYGRGVQIKHTLFK